MNTNFTTIKKGILFLGFALLVNMSVKAATYTAILSGNFSSSASWSGGLIPPALLSSDDIIIPMGINITLDQDQSISGTGSLQVDGTLTGDPGNYLSLTTGSLSGIGNIIVDSLYTSFTSGYNFSGNLMVDNWTNENAAISAASTITVDGMLRLAAGTLDMASGTLVLNNDATIIVSNGMMINSGGTLTLSNNYHVIYTTAATTGIELSGSGLKNITIDIPASAAVMLSGDLEMKGMLNLIAGSLNLNSRNLTFGTTGNLQGIGTISSSSNSDIIINASAGLGNMINFSSGGNTVDDFTINLGNSASKVTINGDLKVAGQLNLQNGMIDMSSGDLSLLTNATITGGSANSYVMTGNTGTLSIDVAANSSQTFHVGTAGNYAPAIISANSTSAASKFSVGVNADVKQNGTTGINLNDTQPLVNATWHVASSATANINVDIETRWSAAMEVNSFDRTKAYLSHYTNGNWDATASASATAVGSMYGIKRTGVTSFSPFAVFDENTSTSVNNIYAENDISIFPNPASDALTITFDGNTTGISAGIYNTTGQLLSTTAITGNTTVINVSALPAGVYYIRIGGATGYGIDKFIKQ